MMMEDLGPVKSGCSLVPHRAENSNIEGEGREQYLTDLVVTESTLPSSRTPKLENCSR